MFNDLNLKTWKRRAQYEFFIGYDDPIFNITTQVDVTNLRRYAQQHDLPFFLASLFVSTAAANRVAEFRYRIRNDKVIVHDVVHIGSTFLMEDETFSFAYFDFSTDIHDFCRAGRSILDECKRSGGMETKGEEDALIYHSVVPWISFTGLKHPSSKGMNTSVPKIVFGKYFSAPGPDGKNLLKMPISVEAHHALMDGFHLGQYFDGFQAIVDSLG